MASIPSLPSRQLLSGVRTPGRWLAGWVLWTACGGPSTGHKTTGESGGSSSSEATATSDKVTMGTAGGATSATGTNPTESAGSSGDTGIDGGAPPRVILMIGDGMGRGQLYTASVYAHGRPDALFVQSLPVHGELITGSLSGITDSAAAATTMATGRRTLNGRIGMDEHAQPLPTLIELAHQRGLASGLVSTAYLPHATPAGFSAHRETRHDLVGIADDQALVVQPHVMFGGGAAYYLPAGADSLRDDAGLIAPLQQAGYDVIWERAALLSLPPTADRVVGLFAPEHLQYVADRPANTTEPTLAQMATAALDILDRDPDGFFVMIEGARIDMAAHGNDIARTIAETVAFDEAVAAVAGWADGRDDVTLIVTADHETGGLEPDGAAVQGQTPTVTWRWGEHTNARVDLFAQGPGTTVFDGQVHDGVWVHRAIHHRLTGEPWSDPVAELTPDGHLAELTHLAVTQSLASSYGVGHNQLEALHLDADPTGLAIGIEGLFKWGRNTVIVLIDRDFGAASGYDGLLGHLDDTSGGIDSTLSAVALTASGVPGFGADFALASFGGTEVRREDTLANAGLRGLRLPMGDPNDLSWLPASTNFGENVRVAQGVTSTVAPGEGLEALIPWTVLFPDEGGGVPPGTRIGIVVVLANDDGSALSNQALPPFAPGTDPALLPLALPGVVEFLVDMDGDGQADGDAVPSVHRP